MINKKTINFIRPFKKVGKQGLAGLCEIEEDNEIRKVVYKISRYLNYTAKHEYNVMKCLRETNNCCPNFCQPIDLVNIPLSSKFREQDNPFQITEKYNITGDVLLMEEVKGKNLYSLVKRESIDDRIIFSGNTYKCS